MKKKLSVILATALSVSMLSQSTMAYAAPVSTNYQDIFAKVFQKLDELKKYNEGKVPELFTDWQSDFHPLTVSKKLWTLMHQKVNSKY